MHAACSQPAGRDVPRCVVLFLERLNRAQRHRCIRVRSLIPGLDRRVRVTPVLAVARLLVYVERPSDSCCVW